MAYNIGDIITVKVAVVGMYEDGGLECCHVGCEKAAATDDTDTLVFYEEDIVKTAADKEAVTDLAPLSNNEENGAEIQSAKLYIITDTKGNLDYEEMRKNGYDVKSFKINESSSWNPNTIDKEVLEDIAKQLGMSIKD